MTGFKNLSGIKMKTNLALMQGKSLAFLARHEAITASFGKAAGKWIVNKDQAIRSKWLTIEDCFASSSKALG